MLIELVLIGLFQTFYTFILDDSLLLVNVNNFIVSPLNINSVT